MPARAVNLAVCGKFHVMNYAPALLAEDVLNAFYFAHRDPLLGRGDPRCVNLWLKEYAVQGLLRLTGGASPETAFGISAPLWTYGVLQHWRPAPVLHQLAVGASGRVISRARKDGATIISEAINTHPGNRRSLISREARAWGLAPISESLIDREERIVDEVFRSDVLLAPTRTVAESYRTRGFTGSIEVIPYAADIRAFSPPTVPRTAAADGKLRVLCIGQIGLRKGQLHLLEAARRMGRNVALTLVGTVAPEAKQALARYADQFHHIERASRPQICELLRQHDVFALPSLEEGLAVSLCEAMATAIAVVATPSSGAEELLTDGVDGLLIPPGDSSAIEGALQRLAETPDLRIKLGQAARRTAEKHNWDLYAQRLRELYARLDQASHHAS